MAGLTLAQTQTVSVEAATGGGNISADTANGTFTALTGPDLVESTAGQIGTGTIVLTLPTGYAFDTASTVTATVGNAGGGSSCSPTTPGNSITLTSNTATVSATSVAIEVNRRSTGQNVCRISFGGLRVRPTKGAMPNAGNITKSGTSNYTANSTNYGTLSMVAGQPTKLAFGVQPSSAIAGETIGGAAGVQVQVLDQYGNLVTNASNSITVAVGTNPGGAALNGTKALNASGGTATFSALSINVAANGYSLTAAATGLTGATSSSFDITAAAANKLAFLVQPSNASAGVPLSPAVQVQVQDQYGNLISTASNSISIAIGNNPAGGALSGTTTISAANGTATFNGLSIDRAGNGYTLQASTTGLPNNSIGSASFDIITTVAKFNVVEVGAPASTVNLFTKLAGTGFSFDVLALDSGDVLTSSYAGSVNVKLVDWDSSGTSCATKAELQDYGSLSFGSSSGRRTFSGSYSNAARNVRVKITDASSGITSCSTDNFSIRPTGFISVTSADMSNAASSGTPVKVAGALFQLSAATGLSGYNGTPKIDNAAMDAHSGARRAGMISGSFPAALSGTASGASFSYSEVGNFRFRGSNPDTDGSSARGVYDDTFTSVDAGNGDCDNSTNRYSNTASGGRYGCSFGITANTSYFGRFIPAKFDLTAASLVNRNALSCSPVSTFSYAGEQFRIDVTLAAKNQADQLTQNYQGNYAKFDGTVAGNFNLGAIDSGPPQTALTAQLDAASAAAQVSSAWNSGVGSFAIAVGLMRPANANGPFEAVRIGIDPVDGDGVRLGSYNLDTSVPADGDDRVQVGSTKIRYGRMRIPNSYGSELLALPVRISTQTWSGIGYADNSDDSCTPIGDSVLSIVQAAGAPITTSISGGGVASSGRRTISLTKPTGFAGKGSVSVTSTISYLPGAARATFGIYKRGPLIYLRENY